MSFRTKNSLRIGVLCLEDPNSKRTWSGSTYRMTFALEQHGHQIIRLHPPPEFLYTLLKLRARLAGRIRGGRYIAFMNRALSRVAAWWFARQDLQRFDVLFAPAGSTVIAELKTDIPILYATDTTFDQIKDYYGGFSDLHPEADKQASEIECAALRKSTWITFFSEWARRFTHHNYGIPSESMFVAPYGPNLNILPDRDAITNFRNEGEQCRLLFLGVDWHRKGGDIALQTWRLLQAQGMRVTMTICGAVPPVDLSAEKDIRVIPFLDKNDPEQERKLSVLLAETDFLLLPTRADCTPVVFSEAAAFGIPVISTNTGGVRDVITHGQNGWLLPLDAAAERYADQIMTIWNVPEMYNSAVQRSRDAFEQRLNWQTWAETVTQTIQGSMHSRTSHR